MFTPQQLEEITFGKAVIGGYDMASVDEVLGSLTQDYGTIYKENEHLKAKMRSLVKKLEEYRNNESSARNATANAQKTCDKMIKDAEEKCAQILAQAKSEAANTVKSAGASAKEENDRVEAAKQAAAAKIAEIQAQMNACIEALEHVKAGNYSAELKVVTPEPPKPKLTGKPSVDRPWMKFYPADAAQMTVPEVTMNEYMKMMSRGDDLTVMHYYGTNITWKQYFRMVEETARSMRAAGLGEGDQIPVMLTACPEFLTILLAAEKIGASLLCRDNTIPENAEAIAKAGSKVMFVHDYVTAEEVSAYSEAGIKKFITVNPWSMAVKSEMPEHIITSLESHYVEPKVEGEEICTWETFIAAGKIFAGRVNAPVDLNRPLFRAYTSGSTGPSKQVIHSAQTMLAVVHQLSAYGSSDELRPTWLVTLLPPALIAITVSMLLMPMASNKLLILDPFVDVNDIDLEMMRYRPNGWPMIPMFVEILMRSNRIPADYDMSHLIAAGAGCESFNNGQVQRAQKFLNDHNCNAIFTVGYGQSEAGSNITFPCPAYPIANGNVGIPMPLNNMGIFRGGRECGYNEKGEICVTGPGNMLGYDNEEATNRTLIRHADGKLWLHTGDTGYMNEDGVVYALGRGLAKRYNPENPDKSKRLVEIAMENQISDAAIPGLIDSFFVIARDPENEGYHVPYLYVVLEKGYTVDRIREDIHSALKEYQYPVEIIQIPERPFYHFKTNRLHMEAPYRRN